MERVEREGRKKMRRKFAIFSVIGATLAALAVGGIGVLSASAQGNENQVDICHSTGAPNNPYVTNHPAKDGDVSGHAFHTGPIFPATDAAGNWGDIIPEFDFDGQHFPGLNNTPEGLAILANDCKLVTPTPPTQPTAPPGPQAAPQAPPAPRVPAAVTAVPSVTG
jgi:hypothetical protein